MNDPEINKKLWEEVGDVVKTAMVMAGGTTSVVFIEKNDATAAIVLGKDDHLEAIPLSKTLTMFRDRLNEMIKNVESGAFDEHGDGMTCIRDSETGEYRNIDPPGFAG